MGNTQNQRDEAGLHVVLPGNPFIAPKDGVCFINQLPPELLCRIFAFAIDYDTDDEDDTLDDSESDSLAEEEIEGAGGEAAKAEGEADSEGEQGGDDSEGDSDSGKTEFSDRLLPYPFPIGPSLVCRYWRYVALSTPSLWTTVTFFLTAGGSYELESMSLERSKSLPIDIWVDCNLHDYCDDADPPSDADLRSVFSMLIPHIHRWRTMHVAVSDYHLMYVFLSAVSDPSIPPAPQLTTLALYHAEKELDEFDTFWYPSMSKHYTLFGGSAPLLTKIVFWGVHVAWGQPWIASASNLTELVLGYHTEDVRPSWAQFASILRGTPALEKLSLCLSGPSGEPQEWFIEPTPGIHEDLNAPVQLPRVTDFDLAFRSPACAIALFRRLYLPTLKNLVLEFKDGDYTDFVHELAGPATSLSPSQERPRSLLSRLESLELIRLPCRDDCAETLYAELQNLSSLKIAMEFLPTSFLNVLSACCTSTGRGDIWLPRLATLYVAGVLDLTKTLGEVVQKRREAGAPLTTLYLDKGSQLHKKDVAHLRENVKTIKLFGGY